MKTADLIDPMSEADKLRMLYRCLSKAYQREKDGLTAAREDAALMIDALINARILLSEGRSDDRRVLLWDSGRRAGVEHGARVRLAGGATAISRAGHRSSAGLSCSACAVSRRGASEAR
jgi:hypothetical protein